MQDRNVYTIQQLSAFSGLTVRTLRHYDDLGLLPARERNSSGHRLYSRSDLLRLQQIMFYRELDVPLSEIAEIVDDPDFSLTEALERHRKRIGAEISRLQKLIATIDTTLHTVNQETMSDRTNEELLYDGFSKEQIEEINAEVDLTYDPAIVAESRKRAKVMTKKEIEAFKIESSDILNGLIAAFRRGAAADSEETLKWIGRHVDTINRFYTPTPEIISGLGDLYVQDPRFTEYYDKHVDGLAAYVRKGMKAYAESMRT
ncbi:MAG: HTH-type transcriptional activator TipA [candidate division WS6 bacterium OLB20]|uniref:HTH-type transcriptional activator TipA n=1 Tax=candidate division WS6 bacterium OLB20 TaxID=1617426 RepID=A0A136LWN4_9BACT|nr:MAG: HTH-type transcriptional activator TipA [candidate division WS6 bacterium OLB20]